MMLKIKTLKPTKPKSSRLIPYIKKHGLTIELVAECVGLTGSYLSTMLNHKELNQHDVNVIKKVVNSLGKRKGCKK